MAVILMVDNYDSFTYNLVQYLGILGEDLTVVRNDDADVETLAALNPDRVVISPGPGRPQDAGVIVPLIRRMAPEVPVLGVCLGHQAIVEAFGGEVVPAVRLMHGKADQVYHKGRGPELFDQVGDGFLAGRYHSLAVHLGPGIPIEVLAESDDGTVMAVRHQRYPTYGIQFHPESILTPDGMQILRNFLKILPPSRKVKGDGQGNQEGGKM